MKPRGHRNIKRAIKVSFTVCDCIFLNSNFWINMYWSLLRSIKRLDLSRQSRQVWNMSTFTRHAALAVWQIDTVSNLTVNNYFHRLSRTNHHKYTHLMLKLVPLQLQKDSWNSVNMTDLYQGQTENTLFTFYFIASCVRIRLPCPYPIPQINNFYWQTRQVSGMRQVLIFTIAPLPSFQHNDLLDKHILL